MTFLVVPCYLCFVNLYIRVVLNQYSSLVFRWRVINLNGEESDNVDIFEFEKSDVTTSNGIFSISNKLNILDSTNHKEKLFEWVEKVESSVTTNKSNDTDSNKTTVKGDQQKKTTAAKEGNCDENGTHEFNENCQDHEEVKEPDEKKLKIEPSVIKFQGTQAMFDKKCEVNTEQLDEDISDDAMVLRHERALTEERRKFQTYLKFPWSTRSRANRRIDSRAESSGANTPDPSSPAPQTPSVGGGDQEVNYYYFFHFEQSHNNDVYHIFLEYSVPIHTFDSIEYIGYNFGSRR